MGLVGCEPSQQNHNSFLSFFLCFHKQVYLGASCILIDQYESGMLWLLSLFPKLSLSPLLPGEEEQGQNGSPVRHSEWGRLFLCLLYCFLHVSVKVKQSLSASPQNGCTQTSLKLSRKGLRGNLCEGKQHIYTSCTPCFIKALSAETQLLSAKQPLSPPCLVKELASESIPGTDAEKRLVEHIPIWEFSRRARPLKKKT